MITRNTIQKSLVLQAVKSLGNHPTADEIYDFTAKQYPNISRATVYRNLNQLAETGAILKIPVPNGAERFDHNCHNHYHIKCEKCGRIFDVDMDAINDLEKRIKDTHGFKFTACEIVFLGVCPRCQQLINA